MDSMCKRGVILLFLIASFHTITGQGIEPVSSSEILLQLKKMNKLVSVLYIAAHPDDENTRLLSYLASGEQARTGYLSLTRGDGGQNLIGSETGEHLGVIRTQELLAARKIDGAEQFFTRAVDFGYSKTAEETFRKWEKDSILADVVWVIRKFRPDVIISRFPPNSYGGHGHHVASGILTQEAFTAAADPSRFPNQLKYVETWKPHRIYFNASTWWWPEIKETAPQNDSFLIVDVGAYNPLLGKGYAEIAALSRSQHKSQGFGASRQFGRQMEYLRIMEGPMPGKALFEGIETTWARVGNSKAVKKTLDQAIENFNAQRPVDILPHLVRAQKALHKLPDSYWKRQKLADLNSIILSTIGLFLEVRADQATVAGGGELKVNIIAVKRATSAVYFEKIDFPFLGAEISNTVALMDNHVFEWPQTLSIPVNAEPTTPFWLQNEPEHNRFRIGDQEHVALPGLPSSLTVRAVINVNDATIPIEVPIIFRWTDRVKGELWRPVEILPPVMVNFTGKVYVFPSDENKKVDLIVKAGADLNREVEVGLRLPSGWRADPASRTVSLGNEGDEVAVSFEIAPPAEPSVGEITVEVNMGHGNGGNVMSYSHVLIDYDHIPMQAIFPKAQARLVKLDIKAKGKNIGYIMGPGDDIPESLRQIGYNVTLLSDAALDETDLSQFDAVIAGIRAFNTRERLAFQKAQLLDYVKTGGTFIVQYNTNRGLVTEEFGPFPLKLSRDRITDETAELKFIDAGHPLLNQPNKISADDFKDWIQERGLYFAGEWDANYVPLLSGRDPGEKDEMQGALLYARYGEGVFIYTGLAFFRQLPAGVPGAYRLFTNLISAE